MKKNESVDFEALSADFQKVKLWLLRQEDWSVSDVRECHTRIVQVIQQRDWGQLQAWRSWMDRWLEVVAQGRARCKAAEDRIRKAKAEERKT